MIDWDWLDTKHDWFWLGIFAGMAVNAFLRFTIYRWSKRREKA